MTQPYETTHTYETSTTTVPSTTSTDDPDAIRREIDRTRGRLAADVDTLGNSVSPSQVAHRTVGRAKGRVASLKDSVMGTAHDVAGGAKDMGSSGADTWTFPLSSVKRPKAGPRVPSVPTTVHVKRAPVRSSRSAGQVPRSTISE